MTSLAGKRVLVVEDELLVAAMLEDMLTDLGAVVVGPAATIAKGLSLVATEAVDAAVLDVNVGGARIDPVAEALKARGIPAVFATGYGTEALPSAGPADIVEKPYTQKKVADALVRALTCAAPGSKGPDGRTR